MNYHSENPVWSGQCIVPFDSTFIVGCFTQGSNVGAISQNEIRQCCIGIIVISHRAWKFMMACHNRLSVNVAQVQIEKSDMVRLFLGIIASFCGSVISRAV